MMKALSLLLIIPSLFFGQVGINTEDPQATLDIRASTKPINGILIPQMSRSAAEAMENGVPNSTLIFIDDITAPPTIGTTANVTSTGFYYFDTSVPGWIPISRNTPPTAAAPLAIISTSSDYSIKDTDFTILASGKSTKITLPDATTHKGSLFNIIHNGDGAGNSDNNPQIITSPSTQKIMHGGSGNTTYTIKDSSKGVSGITVQSNGSDWYVIATAN